MFHVLIGALVAAAVIVRPDAAPFEIRQFVAIAAVVTTGCVVLLPLWPQLQYKPSLRTLTIDPDGWSTTIGARSGSIAWSEVRSIEEAGDAVVIIGANRNSLIVPFRAFTSDAHRMEFLNAARAWHGAAA